MEALKNRLLYAALLLALTLPDICAALESQDGRSTPGRYKAWFNTWLRKKYESQLDLKMDGPVATKFGMVRGPDPATWS
jgi:hypothetical protein